jgi:hypothetical protein
LTDTLSRSWEPSPIKFIEITVHPDSQYNPLPSVRTEFNSENKITLTVVPPKRGKDGDCPSKVYLRIGEGQGFDYITMVYLDSLQNFVRELVPNKVARLIGTEEKKMVMEDLLALTQEMYDKLPRIQYLLQVDGLREPLFRVGACGMSDGNACQLSKFRFESTAEEVEKAMDLLSILLSVEKSTARPRV